MKCIWDNQSDVCFRELDAGSVSVISVENEDTLSVTNIKVSKSTGKILKLVIFKKRWGNVDSNEMKLRLT